MNVLFVNPEFLYGIKKSKNFESVRDLIKALKDDGHIVKIIDSVKEKLNWRELNLRILDFNPKAIIINIGDSENYKEATDIIKDVSGALMIAIGENAIKNPEKIIAKYESIDIVIQDLSKDVIVKILDNPNSLKATRGIYCLKEKQLLKI